MINLNLLAKEIAALGTERPGEYATPYYAVYAHLSPTKSPAMLQRLMVLLNHGATLDAASLLFHAIFPDLSFQITSGRGQHVALAVILDPHYRQISGPHRGACAGHALLLGMVRLALEAAQRVAA